MTRLSIFSSPIRLLSLLLSFREKEKEKCHWTGILGTYIRTCYVIFYSIWNVCVLRELTFPPRLPVGFRCADAAGLPIVEDVGLSDEAVATAFFSFIEDPV
jgi:hypothetical protein